jgi:hypothetical protein
VSLVGDDTPLAVGGRRSPRVRGSPLACEPHSDAVKSTGGVSSCSGHNRQARCMEDLLQLSIGAKSSGASKHR